MLHIVHLVRRRHPARSDVVIARLVMASCAILALGIGLRLLTR